MDWSPRVIALLQPHPLVDGVRLTGSRARGDAGPLSDWDFEFDVADFPAFKQDVWRIVDDLQPFVKQWDRLGEPWTLMLLVDGPVKVDLIFDHPHDDEPPWVPTASNLQRIDDHFWDWVFWLGGKQLKRRTHFVADELHKMFEHLLAPLGVGDIPDDVSGAVTAYLGARTAVDKALEVSIDRRAESEVMRALREAGVLRAS